MRVRLGADLSIISGMLRIDTTSYSMTGYQQQVKQYRLDKAALDRLGFYNNYFDSLWLNFYSDKLLSVDIFASGNRNVEFLKYDIQSVEEKGLRPSRNGHLTSSDSSLSYGTYRELHYRGVDGQMIYDYSEDIVDNIGVLTISSKRLIKDILKKRVH